MISSQIPKSPGSDIIDLNAKNAHLLVVNELKSNNEKKNKGISPVSHNGINRDGEKGKLLQGLSRFALPALSLSPLKISAYSFGALFKHTGSTPEGKTAPSVPPKPSAEAMSAFASQKPLVSEGKIAPPVAPKPSALAMSAFANQKPLVSEGKIAPPVAPKFSALAMPGFAEAAGMLSIQLKNKIIKELNLDNWNGLGGEVTPLVLLDFYKKQNVEAVIHTSIKKEAINKSSINLINVGDHYSVLTINKRGNVELIDVPSDGDCLFHAAVKGQQIAKITYSHQQIKNQKNEHIILKESVKNHFQENFDSFIEKMKIILIAENSTKANNILRDLNAYLTIKESLIAS